MTPTFRTKNNHNNRSFLKTFTLCDECKMLETLTQPYIYIYIYMCVCVCVCVYRLHQLIQM